MDIHADEIDNSDDFENLYADTFTRRQHALLKDVIFTTTMCASPEELQGWMQQMQNELDIMERRRWSLFSSVVKGRSTLNCGGPLQKEVGIAEMSPGESG